MINKNTKITSDNILSIIDDLGEEIKGEIKKADKANKEADELIKQAEELKIDYKAGKYDKQ